MLRLTKKAFKQNINLKKHYLLCQVVKKGKDTR